MIDVLTSELNKTSTENGALAYKSAGSYLLDLFSKGASYRTRSDKEVISLFLKAYSESPTLSMKTLFYIRDIRGGQGERRFFKTVIEYLANNREDDMRRLVPLIPEYGRWDDLWPLLETLSRKDVVELVFKQMKKDESSDSPSLMAKWMPSTDASSKKHREYAAILRKGLGFSRTQYKDKVKQLRSRINVLEKRLTEKEYSSINYSEIPSIAGMKYRDAFIKNDRDRYIDFLDNLSKGKTTVNSKDLYPNEIVEKVLDIISYEDNDTFKSLYDGMWNNLPDYTNGKNDNSLVVADVSGSMSGTPMNVSIALAIYIAERNRGVFKDHFMTFSKDPSMQSLIGDNLFERVLNLYISDWGASTDIEKTFKLILQSALTNSIDKDEMVKRVIIISDMEFDEASRGADQDIFTALKESFNQYGYNFPDIVFWNVDARNDTSPVGESEEGVALVSGYSPVILEHILGGDRIDPYKVMLSIIDSPRYEKVTI